MVNRTVQGAAVKWWVPGDWNGFFGLFTNVLLNVIVLTTLCLYVVHLPSDTIVYGRILPALGIALPLGNLYYAYLAWRLATDEGRDDVTAMPYGPSVPHMFIVVFVIMLIGAFVGPTIRQFTPRAAMLGTLAGISITFIAMRPAFQMWEVPWIAFVSLGIVLISWTANVKLPWGIPGGLAAVIAGTVIGWIAYLFGWTDIVQGAKVGQAFGQFGLHLPIPGGEVFRGLANIWPLLVTAIPLGVYNFTEGMNNVESASAAGDNYNLRNILLADGIGAIVGSVLGSPFPPAVYIGHPGWKAVGGRIGYSLATGIIIGFVCFLGLTALLLAIIPLVAILPILLYIGLVIGAQAFTASPAKHAPAVVLAIIPNIAAWGQLQVEGALGAAGVSADKVIDALGNNGVLYHGMSLLGGGAVLAGLILGAMAAFIIDRDFNRAAIYSLAGAVLAFFGFIHGVRLSWMAEWQVALGYALFAVICYVVGARESAVAAEPAAAKMRAAE